VQEELGLRERLLESKKKVSRRQSKEHGKDFRRIARDPRGQEEKHSLRRSKEGED
jgi:hypothetical protein